jgi:rhodanese-related sulfurtransferase
MKNSRYLILMLFFLVNCSSQKEIKSISTKELKVLLAKQKIQLIDVRSPEEIKEGAIKTALFANYYEVDFHKKASEQLDKNKPVYLYCRSGNRSAKASKILDANGFNVINVSGGYVEWKKEN